jgi:predicted RNase H-like HicB family nuclease
MPEALMVFEISFDREDDGCWIAEAVELPGVLAYGATKEEARAKAQALAIEVVAEQTAKI